MLRPAAFAPLLALATGAAQGEIGPDALDREHYVTKQVKPVAGPVLETLGLDFDCLVGDECQLELLGGF